MGRGYGTIFMKIPATIGILTYNSEEHLSRALESVRDFAEIIIADGGSTDETLTLARAYGARVIPQSTQGVPISDFSRERNITLRAATQPWFFYLDADESMSPELVEHMRVVTSGSETPFAAYRVRYLKTNSNLSKIYRTYKEYYQLRMVRTDIGARFERPVHERIVVPAGTAVGQTEAPWYVPLEDKDLSFRVFARKAWKRTSAEVAGWHPRGIGSILRALVTEPIMRIGKSLVKMVVVKLRFGANAIPARYELLRIVYAIFLWVQHVRRCINGRSKVRDV